MRRLCMAQLDAQRKLYQPEFGLRLSQFQL